MCFKTRSDQWKVTDCSNDLERDYGETVAQGGLKKLTWSWKRGDLADDHPPQTVEGVKDLIYWKRRAKGTGGECLRG